MNVADMLIDIYLAESMLLRVEKMISKNGEEGLEAEIAMVRTYVYDSADRINKAGKDALSSFADGDELKMMLMGMKRFTKMDPLNVKEMRQKIAMRLIEKNAYDF